ncbi:3-beta hydroxysteroid dehydrogenase/isomerase family-domain-containing protein [Pisolithus albus]|nr:3-beta hydroxysteroid dehydrogenase/isomerase family-domain-containing protein [Pisolithus albus]
MLTAVGLAEAISSGTTCIIHTASPEHGAKDPSLYYKINVGGTRAVVNAAIAARVRKLVYTSSAGVVFDGTDVVHLDERVPYPAKPFDAYNDSKAHGEKIVLEASGKGGLLTVALHPETADVMASLYQAYQRGQTPIQAGDNNNLSNYTYVGNVAQARLLAADKLVPPPLYSSATCGEPKSDPENTANARVQLFQSLHRALPHLRKTPRSLRHPLYAESTFNTPFDPHELKHPIVRSRSDQFSENALAVAEGDPLRVDGQAFFITNGEPVYFWDFTRYVWMALNAPTPEGSKNQRAERKILKIPRAFGMILGLFSEYHEIQSRYHCIGGARGVLGYVPEVGLEEGVKKMVEALKKENGLQ